MAPQTQPLALQNGSLATLTNYTREYPSNLSPEDTDTSMSHEYSMVSVSKFSRLYFTMVNLTIALRLE